MVAASVVFMRVATWNVNSIRSRAGRVVDWLVREDIDVLGMQEIKCKPEQFPYDAFTEAGYEIELHGLNQWNGVAFASRLPMTDVTIGFEAGNPVSVNGKKLSAVALLEQLNKIAGDNGGNPIDAHAIQPFYTGLLARTCGMTVALAPDGETIVLTAQ